MRSKLSKIIFMLLSIVLLSYGGGCTSKNISPYPDSSVIYNVKWELSTHKTAAPGSDNWPMTWADDGHLYTSWGDGGGFGGTNSDGRVSLGVARIEGPMENYSAVNVWGGKDPENPSQFKGKSYGLLSIEGIIYMWINVQDEDQQYKQSQITVSRNHAKTFEKGFKFAEPDRAFAVTTFINFGKDYEGARDGYVYVYGGHPLNNCTKRCIGRDIYLARVAKDRILDQGYYEFFNGFDENSKPKWSASIKKSTPVFTDTNGASVRMGVVYNPGLKRYLLTLSHNNSGGLGIFDAPEPWGPWTTVMYYDNWLGFGYSPSYHIAPQKWMSEDGRSFIMVWSSKDKWNSIKGTFHVAGK